MGGGRNSSSSSGEEDGDAEWRAAIDSVTAATTTTFIKQDSNGRATHEDDDEKHEPQNIKHYQIKAQKLLDDILDKTIEVVTDTAHILDNDPKLINAGIRLFKLAPAGIVFDHLGERTSTYHKLFSHLSAEFLRIKVLLLIPDELHGPKKKPKLVPGEDLDEKSKKFRKQLQSAAVDGADIISAAIAASQKSLAKLEARDAAAKAAAKREEERVAELKKIRGERWLPSVARQMRVNTQCKR
ncbi:hypothetical protein DH2020_016081 [Rehmannia glutinosa]|uniref:Uncharacterized protein n=1 Tax=Rehmannia glutinosa TaxID=99300 RepID=A0ABR0WVI4_REHGL